MSKKRYQKPETVKQLENKYFIFEYAKKSHIPEYARVKEKFRDDTANGLTKCIIKYLTMQGAFVTRLNSTGIYRNNIQKFVPNTQRKGMPDVYALIDGKTLFIEVKIGKDRLSYHQIKVQNESEANGASYIIARNFTDFLNEYNAAKAANNQQNGNRF